MFKLNKGSNLENKFRSKVMEHWMILSQVFIYSMKNGIINRVLETKKGDLNKTIRYVSFS